MDAIQHSQNEGVGLPHSSGQCERLENGAVEQGSPRVAKKQPVISWWTVAASFCWTAGVGLLAWRWYLKSVFWEHSRLMDDATLREQDYTHLKWYAAAFAAAGVILGWLEFSSRRGRPTAITLVVWLLNLAFILFSARLLLCVVRD
jgi:hypothetical protein